MRMLVVTHIAAFAGQSPGVIRWREDWLVDLHAQARAMREVGFDLVVAAPVHDSIDARSLANQQIVDVRLSDQPFEFVALPGYRTATQFVSVRSLIRRTISERAGDADVVQIGPGGHPVSLGQTVWPAIAKADARRVMRFNTDPIPAWQKYASTGRNPAKRLAKQMAARQLESFCHKSIREADLVIAHDPSVATRFAKSWADHCHTVVTTGLPDSVAGTPRTPDGRRPMRVFAVGSDNYTRGLDHLLKAVAKARRLTAKVELHLSGDLQGSAEMMNLIRDEKLESHVRLLGRITPAQHRDLLDAADLFVSTPLASLSDPIIDLAQARGLPILTYQTGPRDEDLVRAGCGVVVARGDVNMLAQVLIDLSRNRCELAAMSERAIERAKSLSLDAVHRQRAKLVSGLV
jgi:glycosyltransferase involved in cell wall biosynthesis